MTDGNHARPSGPSNDSLRDIALVLFGLALSKSHRERVLNSLPPGSLPLEIERLFDDVRQNGRHAVQSWCESHCVYLENGKDVTQAIIETIACASRQQSVRRIIMELKLAVQMEDVDTLIDRLKQCVTMLEQLP